MNYLVFIYKVVKEIKVNQKREVNQDNTYKRMPLGVEYLPCVPRPWAKYLVFKTIERSFKLLGKRHTMGKSYMQA